MNSPGNLSLLNSPTVLPFLLFLMASVSFSKLALSLSALSLTSRVIGGTWPSFSLPDSTCLRNSTFFLLARK
uniref:Uncharacterized protein n=1 Tax=Ixodes ricinus TaxID=34613 RepID=A0A6B0U2Y7_IXORI